MREAVIERQDRRRSRKRDGVGIFHGHKFGDQLVNELALEAGSEAIRRKTYITHLIIICYIDAGVGIGHKFPLPVV
jgi:hypothetical protein